MRTPPSLSSVENNLETYEIVKRFLFMVGQIDSEITLMPSSVKKIVSPFVILIMKPHC